MSIVAGYELELSNGLPYAVARFIPARGGGESDWDGARSIPVQAYVTNHQMNHEWSPVSGAVSYDIAFSVSYCNIVNLMFDLRDGSEPAPANVYNGSTTGTTHSSIHDCIHLPIYFLARARFSDGTVTNRAITYHNMFGPGSIGRGDCGPHVESPIDFRLLLEMILRTTGLLR